MAQPYAYCPRCHMPYALTRAGGMYPHRSPRNMDKRCPGSGLPPEKGGA